MTLLLILAVLAAFAIAVEALNFIAPDFIATMRRDAALKESVANTQKEVAESEKRLDGLRRQLRALQHDLSRATDGLEKLDEQFAERRRAEPVLVYLIASANKVPYRFRAPLSKALPAEPEDSQAMMWGSPAFVEVEANSADEAKQIAARQFPSQNGYAVGAFAPVANGEAAA